MKVTYNLTSDDLKSALIPYIVGLAYPVSMTDEFSVDASGNVTIVSTPVLAVHWAPRFACSDYSNRVAGYNTSRKRVADSAFEPDHVAGSTTSWPPVTVDPPLSVTGPATEFGYRAPTDNGLGFFTDPATGKPYQTNNDVSAAYRSRAKCCSQHS